MEIFRGIVAWVALVIVALALALLFVEPASWPVALVALLFLPVGGFVLHLVARMRRKASSPRRDVAVRASMVGGGALLISALGTRIAEAMGWIGAETNGRSLVSIVFVLVIVGGDFLAARMERQRRDEDDPDGT